ncbi:MAG TPA: hypothetical protein VFU81_17270 [Thermomicrobiales bacterium]|nr:hypothetical protein [Thermomicrobiales bacterium]
MKAASQPTTRRVVIRSAAALTLGGALARSGWGRIALAQEATPVASFPMSLGLPEFRITISDTGFQAPNQIAAGQVLLTATNNSRQPADANLVLPPSGIGLHDVAALFGPAMATAVAAGTPPEGAMASWVYQATWAGGLIVPAGQTLQGVVDLTPGDWILLNDSPASPQQPQTVTVGAGAAGTAAASASPMAGAEIPADVTVELQEYAFLGLDHPIPAGPHIWKFSNTGKQPHFMLLTKGPAGITLDQVMTLVNLSDNATPPPGFPYQESQFDFNQPGVAVLSPGHTSWVAMDLTPGTYIALCFVPDEKTGAPHAAMGMIAIFTVGEGMATPAA